MGEAVCKSADKIIGFSQNIPALAENTYKIIKFKAAVKARNDNAEQKRLQGVLKARAKADRNTYLS